MPVSLKKVLIQLRQELSQLLLLICAEIGEIYLSAFQRGACLILKSLSEWGKGSAIHRLRAAGSDAERTGRTHLAWRDRKSCQHT
ncbi:MAG: hypothetical protein HYU64_01955 [Armatimonadetes bacterium]|nr:hypothetical protein [Armatimonadota bacterium]